MNLGSSSSTRLLTTLAMLSSLAVVGRIAFSFLPNIQPATTIILLAALSFGPIAGVVIAIVSTVVTNFFLGAGMWTVWQIAAWSVIALITGSLVNVHTRIPIYILSLYAGLCGLIYGLIISIPMSKFVGSFWAYYLSGLPFDISHSIGNIVFFTLMYPIYFKVFKKNINIIRKTN
ncbi:ECF transporter S component [Anaerobacillus sp. CMMVII]|nr:ECF transporter S component [Anaerobacillus sp. CMMVII]